MEEKYIDLLLKRCLSFGKSKSLMINLDLEEHFDFALKVKKRANELGIFDVYIHCNDEIKVHDYLKNTDVSDIKLNELIDRSPWDEYAIKGGSLLFLLSDVPGLMDDIEPEKIQKLISEREKTCKFYRENVTKYAFPWCIAALPNERWAKSIFPNDEDACEMLESFIYKMCMVDTKNPIDAWDKYIMENNRYKNRLSELGITRMHYTNSLGTDFYIEKPIDNIWMNLDKGEDRTIFNMPSYEIFTTPNKYSSEGIVYSSKPLIAYGNYIDDFYLEFKDGKVINCYAKKGQKALEDIISMDDNSCYLGEVALVNNDSPISNTGIVFNTTLFDENASCHFALGKAYSKCIPNFDNMNEEELNKIGYNKSIVHTDFMIGTSDLNIEADTKEGKKLIFKNGNFNI